MPSLPQLPFNPSPLSLMQQGAGQASEFMQQNAPLSPAQIAALQQAFGSQGAQPQGVSGYNTPTQPTSGSGANDGDGDDQPQQPAPQQPPQGQAPSAAGLMNRDPAHDHFFQLVASGQMDPHEAAMRYHLTQKGLIPPDPRMMAGMGGIGGSPSVVPPGDASGGGGGSPGGMMAATQAAGGAVGTHKAPGNEASMDGGSNGGLQAILASAKQRDLPALLQLAHSAQMARMYQGRMDVSTANNQRTNQTREDIAAGRNKTVEDVTKTRVEGQNARQEKALKSKADIAKQRLDAQQAESDRKHQDAAAKLQAYIASKQGGRPNDGARKTAVAALSQSLRSQSTELNHLHSLIAAGTATPEQQSRAQELTQRTKELTDQLSGITRDVTRGVDPRGTINMDQYQAIIKNIPDAGVARGRASDADLD